MKKKSKRSKKINKKKFIRSIRIITILSIVIILAIVILCCSGVLNKQSEPVKTLIAYMSYINEENYAAMYDMLSNNSKDRITKETFIERNQNIYNRLEANNVHLSDITEQEENGKTKIMYSIEMETIAGTLKFANTARLEPEERKIWSNLDFKYNISWI